ncbi:MAG: DUF1003 domain-containing protein [Candidatus Woesearchaeota archaeon]
MVKKRFNVIPRSIKAKYSWGDTVPASGIYECSICGNYEAFKKGEFFSQCQDCINSHRHEENKWFVTNEFLYFMSKNMNIEFENVSSLQIRIADKISEWAGSMGFVYIHILWFGIWVIANLGYFGSKYVFDPFPYGLLTMIVSLEAIFLATFIMISQNISSKKSELRAEHEYQINLETEKNVAELLALMKEMRKDTELKHEAIEDIKETVEEIAEHTEDIAEKTDRMELLEETDKILDDAGIDTIEELETHEEKTVELLPKKKKKTYKKSTPKKKSAKKSAKKKLK